MAAAVRYVILGLDAYRTGEVEAALSKAGAVVLDETPAKAILVSGPPRAIEDACAAFPGVRLVPERSFKLDM